MIANLHLVTAIATVGILTALTACAGRPESSPAARTASSISRTELAQASGGVRKVAEVASLDASPIATPTGAGRLDDRIAGTVLGVDREGFVVVQKGTNMPAPASPSLFEDSIVLTKVRGRLYLLSDLPASVISDARVRSGTVFLIFPSGISIPAASAAINAALETTGVREVRARVPQRLLAVR